MNKEGEMAKKLFDYQQKIVDSQNEKSSALFMDMGTGKTVTSLALFRKSQQPKLLVICILSKLQDWQDDVLSECGLTSIILNKGTKKNEELIKTSDTNVFIVNFESAWRCKELLNWVDKNTYILIDESHKIKSVNSKIGKFCAKLKTKTKTKCILTGTPQSKGYIDYYNQLSFIDVIKMPYKMFTETFCVYELRQFSGYPFKELVGYKNKSILDRMIKEHCVFFKRDVDNEQIPMEIDVKFNAPKEYKKFKKIRIYEDYVADNSSKMFVTCRKMCSGFIDEYIVDKQKITWLRELCEDLTFRLVIFYNFNCERDSIVRLMQDLKIPYSLYNGSEKDLTNFDKYENGVAICQYMSASLGLNNLVKSNVCIMYSPSTNYTDYIQSKKRIDRIGQTKKPLFYNLYCKGTVEEKILETIKSGSNFDDKMFENYLKESGGK